MSSVEEIRNQALGLSVSDRAALARDLILSLEGADLEQDAAAAWADEIEARSEAVHRGEFVARSWEESLERVRRFVAERHGCRASSF